MSNKYTIKNCELTCNGECPNSKTGYCQDCIDCKLKQIVELCRERSNKCERCKTFEDYQPTDCLHCGNDDVVFANDILELFEIEEVE